MTEQLVGNYRQLRLSSGNRRKVEIKIDVVGKDQHIIEFQGTTDVLINYIQRDLDRMKEEYKEREYEDE